MTKKRTTPRIAGRTRKLEKPRGTGPWLLLALAVTVSVGAVLLTLPEARSAEAPQEALEVWLVRHAEKVDDSRDPELSEAGHARAALLADLLAEALGVEVELYDPRDLEGFAEELRGMGGVHLVVGHSNTTPGMVEALGGDPVSPIDEAEYDRLYRVWLGDDGAVHSELRRFGVGFRGG